MRKVLNLLASIALVLSPIASTAVGAEPGPGKFRRVARPVAGQYIVVLRDDIARERVGEIVADLAAARGEVLFVYRDALRGFAVRLGEYAARVIAEDERVAFVEEDGEVTIDATQSSPVWGLDRIDQRSLPLSATYSYNTTGSGVRAYVIDTGIRTSHVDFGGRASGGYTAINDGNGSSDCNGHGTHVAGTVGGSTYGVAKSVSLIAVRVLSCSGSGSNSGVIAGVDWVTANGIRPAVANMSLGGSANSSIDTAVRNSIASGITYVVAAGNSNYYASSYSPARVTEAITVGATTSSDARASYSNYGSALDLFAPGSSVTSAWYTSNTAINTISGTSMASPHVAGAVARYLQTNPSASPSTVSSWVRNNATTNVVTNPGTNSANRLLYIAP